MLLILGVGNSFWEDYINAVIESNRCKYFFAGFVFKAYLR